MAVLDTTSGIVYVKGGTLTLSSVTVTGNTTSDRFLASSAGSAGAPSFSFSAAGEDDNGMFRSASNVLGFSTGGTERLTLSTTALTSTLKRLGPDGTSAAPTYGFSSDTDSGLFLQGDGLVGISAGNGARLMVSSSNQVYPGFGDVISLGRSDISWLSVYANSYFRAGTLLISATAPTTPVACTSPTVVWSNGTASFEIDVGTTCAGVSTLAVTLPASTNGWECTASNVTTAARDVWATAWTTTSVTFTNTARTTGLATDWADGANVRVKCMAG